MDLVGVLLIIFETILLGKIYREEEEERGDFFGDGVGGNGEFLEKVLNLGWVGCNGRINLWFGSEAFGWF